MPLTSSEDFADIFSSRKSGSGSNAAYQISSKNLSIGSDATGRLYLKVTIPAQGETKYKKKLFFIRMMMVQIWLLEML